MHVTEIPWIDPFEAARRLRPLGGLTLLDSAMRHPVLGRWSYAAASPFGVHEVRDGRALWNGDVEDGPPLAALKRRLGVFRPPADPRLPPFRGGALGFFAYEFGRNLERLPRPARRQAGVPEARWRFHDVVVAFDHLERRALVLSSGLPEPEGPARSHRAAGRSEAIRAALAAEAAAPGPDRAAGPFAANFDRAAFEAAVARTVEYVLAGDIFQANVARRFAAPLPAGFDPLACHGRLRRLNPAPFAAFVDGDDVAIASSSPERFVTVRGGRAEARPIKGTIRRSDDPVENDRLAATLLASEKDRAENVMIVDLLRNDLSRVCRPHSVRVPVLNGLETYATVHHLVSVVEGDLEPGLDAVDVVGAAFPGGSITGAPKIRAMEIIAGLEGVERGVYCGSIGWLGFGGDADLNIAIRTAQFVGGEAVVHAGGGITALSEPASEYEETELKAAPLLRALSPEEGP